MDIITLEQQIADRLETNGLELQIIARQLRHLPFCAVEQRLSAALVQLQEIANDGSRVLDAEGQQFNESEIKRHASLLEIRREVEEGDLQITNSIVRMDGIQLNGHRYWHEELDSYVNENIEIAHPSKSKNASEVYAFLSANYYCVAQMVEMGGA